MNSFWRFLRNKRNEQVLGWLGGGLVVAATGPWAAFVYFFPPGKSPEGTSLEPTPPSVHLGIALRTLGEREGDTARLEEAVAAFRDALKERTRERVPLDWAMTQNNLGIALRTLGEREG